MTTHDDGSETKICIDGKQRLTSIQRCEFGLLVFTRRQLVDEVRNDNRFMDGLVRIPSPLFLLACNFTVPTDRTFVPTPSTAHPPLIFPPPILSRQRPVSPLFVHLPTHPHSNQLSFTALQVTNYGTQKCQPATPNRPAQNDSSQKSTDGYLQTSRSYASSIKI